MDGGLEPTKSEPTPNKLNDNRDFSSLAVQVDEKLLTKTPRESRPVVSQDVTTVARLPKTQTLEVEENKKYIKETERLKNEAQNLEKLKEAEQQDLFKQQNILALQDPELGSLITQINKDLIDKEEREVTDFLNKKFSKFGFHFESTGVGDAVIARTIDGKKSIEIDLDPFLESTEIEESEKLRKFISSNSQPAYNYKDEDYITKAVRAQSLRELGMKNDDGTESTVKFTSFEQDGKHFVIPTLFPKNPFDYSSEKKDWLDLPFDQALNEARLRGEVFEFDNEADAQKFAEGDWKNVNAFDIEGQRLYRSKGLDYYTEKKKFENYTALQDEVELLEKVLDRDVIAPEEKLKYPQYFAKDGRPLYSEKELEGRLDKTIAKKDQLLEQVFDVEFLGINDGPIQKTREEFDLVLDKKQKEIQAQAIKQNNEANSELEQVNLTSMNLYGVPIEKLYTVAPKTSQDVKTINDLVIRTKELIAVGKDAANKFEVAKTYYDAKWNKAATEEYEENFSGFKTALADALENGRAAEQILLTTLGIKDVDINSDRKDIAAKIAEASSNLSGKQSRVLTRLNLSRDGEFLKTLMSDPLEAISTFTASSFTQILPYGSYIIPTFVASGIATGAAIGGSTGGAPGAVAGAAAGLGYGARAGMSASFFALEYTNSILDVMKEKGYDITDPLQVEKGLMDESVWSEGGERGVKRGIPIAIVDYLSAGLAGKIFKVSKIAPTATRVGALAAERVLIDPTFEMAGEFAAQKTAGQEVNLKDIAYEGLGGIGSNTSMMGLNMYLDSRNQTSALLALELTDINTLASQRVSDGRISNWANNMQQLGKIDADVNQRIQQNVGLRREARDLLSVGSVSRLTGNTSKSEARVMELLAARQELTSTQNRREVNSDKIKAINQELAELSENKKVKPKEEQVNLDLILGTKREGVSRYQIGGKVLSKEQFNKEIANMSAKNLLRSKIKVDNDKETQIEILNKQLDAIQKQTAGEVPVQPGATVSEEVAQGEPQAEPQVTAQESIKEKLNEVNKKSAELQRRQQLELEELNKKENKNYRDAFDILNVNEYSEDQTQRSQEAIDLANRHTQEFNDSLQEKRNIESEAEKLNFSDYNLTDNNKLETLRESINSVYQNNRGALDEGFEASINALEEANSVGGNNYLAHGMGKTNLANAYNDLINLFKKGINPIRGRGSLDVAPLSGGVSTGTTASGNAYMDGPFTLVANRNHSGPITNINQVGGIIVNEGLATPEVLTSLRDLFPNLAIESTSNTKSLIEQLNSKTQEGQVQEVTQEEVVQEVTPNQELDLDGEVALLEQLLAQEETAPTVSAGVSILSDTDVQELRNKTQSRSQQATTKQEKDSANARVKIIDSAKRAINTLRSVFPEIDIVLHDNEGSYNAAMLEVSGVEGSKGNLFLDTTPDGKSTGRIDINLSKADGRTVAHEIAHAILLKSFGDNSRLFNDFRTRLSNVLNTDANKELNDFAARYVDPNTGQLLDVNHEEFLAELTGMLEQQETNVSVTTMQKIAALINEFVSKITGGKFKPFENTKNTKDVVEFFNTISGAIREGKGLEGVTEKINSNAESTGTNVNTSSLKRRSSLIEKLGLERFSDMDNRITEGITLSGLGDIISHLTFSDRLVTGKVGNKDYLGGILFAAATNRVWASFTKTRVSQIINGMPKNEDGYRYLMPALLTEGAHMSNKDMSNTAIKLVEDAISKGDISPVDADSRIRKALNRKGLDSFFKLYSDTIGNNKVTPELVISAIDNAIIKSSSTFEDRNTFLESLLGKADIDLKKRFGTLPSYNVLANGLAEPITSGHEFGDILLAIRTKGDLVAVQPKEGDPDYHPSYPWVIRSVNADGSIADVETLIFKQSYNAVNVFPEVTNKQGQKFTYQQYVDKYGEGAKSRYLGYMGARSAMSTSVTEKVVAKAEPKSKVVSRAQLPGNDAQRIVNLGRANGLSDQAISNVLEKRGFTQGAIDIALGKTKSAAKKAPSAEKIIGKPGKKKVTVDEMAALKDQIKLEARAAREAKGDLNKKRKALAARIITARRKGVITDVQARAIVNRISKVNLDNPIMVDRLIEYTDKVFDNANYAAEMTELRKLQQQAKRKNHTSMTNVVNQFTSINPEDIPLDRIQDYKEALDFLNTRSPFYGNMNEVFDEMLSYKVAEKFDAVKTKDALMDKYKSIMDNKVKTEEKDNKLKTVEDYVALIKDINAFKRKAYQLLQNDTITQEEYDDLINGAGETQADIEKKFATQIAKIKNDLISEIKNQRPRVSGDFSNSENDLIRKYLELSDTDLQSLSPEDLFILNDLLYNISNGEIDVSRFSPIVSKAYTSSGLDPLAKQINKSNFDKSSDEGRQELSEQESAFWQGLLGMGRAKAGALQKFIVSPFNRAIASYEKFSREGLNEFLKLKKKYKIDSFDPLKRSKDMHKIGILTTYLQEYMAQFDSKNKDVKDIGKRDWFKEIINDRAMRDNYSSGKPSVLKSIGLGKSEVDIIEEIWKSLPKNSDGNVDPKAVYDSYMANDGKFFTKKQKAFFDDVMAYKASEITPKQKFANELSGASFKEIPFHMMRVRLDKGKTQISPTASSENNNVRITAGTGKERVSEKVGAVMTNFEKLFISGIEQTGRDYFLSNALQDINNTLAGVKKIVGDKKIELINTISYTLSDALKFEFDRTRSNFIFRNLLSARAAQTLLRPIRTAVELGSTLVSYPVRAKTLSGYKSLFGEQGAMKKLLEFTDSPMLLRNNISKAIDINDGSIEPQSAFTKATNYLSGLPERTMMVTSWMPTFKSEFKNITGLEFDMKKFNDSEAYREKYGKAIRESSAAADAQTEKIIGPTTKAGQRREVRIAPRFLANLVGAEGTVSKNTATGQILGFFSNYPFRESTEFLNGFREAAEVLNDEGALSSLSQLQKPLGVALNVAAYSFLSSATYALSLILLGDDDDEERGEDLLKSLLTGEGLLEELKSNAISLAGSQYAAGGKAIIQLAATILIESTDDEELKAKYKKLLKDSVFIDPLPVDKALGFKGEEEIAGSIGKYIPPFVVAYARYADLIGTKNEVKEIYDKVESKGVDALTEDEGLKVLALNTLFNSAQIVLNLYGTSIPEYNYIKTYMKKLKEDAGVAEVYKGEVPAKKKSSGGRGGSSRGGGMNKTDMKKYKPELYNQMYGPGSAMYEIEQEVKAFEKEQREFKKKMKDQIYGGD